MPRGNGTGPQGMGTMTGRGAGYCPGTGDPGYSTAGMGAGRSRGMRWDFTCRGMHLGGRGQRNMPAATGEWGRARSGGRPQASQRVDPEWERRLLNEQAEMLTTELEHIKVRLAQIDRVVSEK